MYGAGLERIVELADAGTRDEMSKDSLVAGLLMIHDLYPVPIEERVVQALDTVQAVHGVARRQRRAARDRGRDREAAARGQLQVVPGVVVDARAGGAPGARGGGAGPARDGRGGRLEEEEAEVTGVALPMVNGAPAWHTLDIGAPEALAATDVDGVPLFVANVDGTLLAYRNTCAELRRRA